MATTHIKNEGQYKKYLSEIESLAGLDPDVNSSEGERLSLLSLAVEEYENEHFAFNKPSPIEAIRFRMDEQGLKQTDLIPYIGSASKVSEILSGKRRLTVPMIRALSTYLKIPADLLINEPEEDTFKVEKNDLDWGKFPLSEMRSMNWISADKKDIRDNPESVMITFLKPIDSAGMKGMLWRRSFYKRGDCGSSHHSLIAWAARVMILAKQEKIVGFKRERLTKEFLNELAKLSSFDRGPLLAKEFLNKQGIKLIVVPHLSGTYLDGASFVEKDGCPVVALTLRHDRLDNFWFTLMHELAHIYKHLKDDGDMFLDDIEQGSPSDPREKEADNVAKDAFIPKSIWKSSDAFTLQTEAAIRDLATQLSIHPAIVAGRIRYETKQFKSFGNLVGQGAVATWFKTGV